jgi:hypothetical protein
MRDNIFYFLDDEGKKKKKYFASSNTTDAWVIFSRQEREKKISILFHLNHQYVIGVHTTFAHKSISCVKKASQF